MTCRPLSSDGFENVVAVISFNWYSSRWLNRLPPCLLCGMVTIKTRAWEGVVRAVKTGLIETCMWPWDAVMSCAANYTVKPHFLLGPCLPHFTGFSKASSDWKIHRVGQSMTWESDMKNLTHGLADANPITGLGLRDSLSQWLETVGDITQYPSQWPSCIGNLFSSI